MIIHLIGPAPTSIVSLKLSEACLIDGSNVSLRCLTSGFPRPNITFRLNDEVITPGLDRFENYMEEYFDQVSASNVLVHP